MRRVLLMLAGLLALGRLSAQADIRRFSYSVSVGTAVDLSRPSSTPFLGQIAGYYNVSPRLSAGAGTGLFVYEKALLPLYGTVKFRLARPCRLAPYVECGTGYSFALSSRAQGGFYLPPSIGAELAIKGGPGLLFCAGYDVQRLRRLKSYRDEYFAYGFAERLNHRSVSFRIGMLF